MTRIINEDGGPLTDDEAAEVTEWLYALAETFGWSMVITRDPMGNMEFTTDYGEGKDGA